MRALISLRWTMIRSRRVRRTVIAIAAAAPIALVAVITVSRVVPQRHAFDAAILMPTALLAYAALAVVGPLASGGGNELFPADELVAHPVRPATMFAASLALAPLNVAWVGQTAGLLVLAGYVAGSWHALPVATVLTLCYIVTVTTAGQATAWAASALTNTVRGRRVAWSVVAAIAIGVALVFHVGVTRVLDRAPTRPVVTAMLDAEAGRYTPSLAVLAVLAAIAVVALAAGPRAAARALQQPPGVLAARQARPLPRRPPRRLVAGELRAVDRASVWRAAPLRRGVLVIGLLPGLAAAALRVDWPGLALTAGLTTAGAGLLFGINVFCLDGSGGLWLASLPVSSRSRIWAKARIIAEACLSCGVLTAAAGALRAKTAMSAVDLADVAGSVLACSAVVVSACLAASVTRPHRADLRGPRDTPAPHGAMAGASARLAVRATLVCLAVGAAAGTGDPVAPALVALAIVLASARSIYRTVGRYARPTVGANVTITVATG